MFSVPINLVFGLIIVIIFSQASIMSVYSQPIATNPKLTIEKIFTGHFKPTTMAILGPDDILILDRDAGKIYRITDGILSEPLLDVKVSTEGYRGLIGIAVSNKGNVTPNVFLYFTEARNFDGDDRTNKLDPLGNRVYKYELADSKLVNQKLLLDLPALPGPRHPGGIIEIGPDNNLYVTIGDIDGTFRTG